MSKTREQKKLPYRRWLNTFPFRWYFHELFGIFSYLFPVFSSSLFILQAEEYYSLERMVRQVDEALLEYEQTVAVAADEGINMTSKECIYKWGYVQSVFFSSTIITTVGKKSIYLYPSYDATIPWL